MDAKEMIKEELKIRNISQKQLAEMIGKTESVVSKFLNSETAPRTDILVQIANALNLSVYQLLGIKSNKEEGIYTTCRMALARNGEKLSEEEKTELVKMIINHE